MSNKNTAIVLRGMESLATSELLTVDPADLNDSEALLYWSLFDVFEKEFVKKRKDLFKAHLLELATEYGVETKPGSVEYMPPHSDGKITKQKRKGKMTVDLDKATELLLRKKIFSKVAVGVFAGTMDDFTLIIKALEEFLGMVKDKNEEEYERILELLTAVKPVVNEQRLEAAFNFGWLTPEDLQEISAKGGPTFALVVKKPSEVTKMVKKIG